MFQKQACYIYSRMPHVRIWRLTIVRRFFSYGKDAFYASSDFCRILGGIAWFQCLTANHDPKKGRVGKNENYALNLSLTFQKRHAGIF